jgi:hypothetical protein
MLVTGIWFAFLVAGALIEALGWLRPNRVSTIHRAVAKIEDRIAGRAVLILLWVFIGFHLFVRDTVPHS